MSVKFSLLIDDKAWDTVIDSIDINAILPDVASQTATDLAPIRAQLATDAPKVKYPIEWTSEKQRRAFFATDGFGSGIPYKRTSQLRDRWAITSRETSESADIVISNVSRVAKYVYGYFGATPPQQRFHANTGWQTISNKRQAIVDTMVSTFIANLNKALK